MTHGHLELFKDLAVRNRVFLSKRINPHASAHNTGVMIELLESRSGGCPVCYTLLSILEREGSEGSGPISVGGAHGTVSQCSLPMWL